MHGRHGKTAGCGIYGVYVSTLEELESTRRGQVQQSVFLVTIKAARTYCLHAGYY